MRRRCKKGDSAATVGGTPAACQRAFGVCKVRRIRQSLQTDLGRPVPCEQGAADCYPFGSSADPIFFRPGASNFGKYVPPRTQAMGTVAPPVLAKVNKMESEIDQKGNPKRAQSGEKCGRGGGGKSLGETGFEKVPVKFRLNRPLLSYLAPLGRFWVPFLTPLDFEGVPKSIVFENIEKNDKNEVQETGWKKT